MQPHVGHLYRLAYRLTNQQQAAEDLVQDILVQFYPRRHELADIDKLRPWLARSLYNRFIDNIRRNKRNPLSDAGDETILDFMPDYEAVPERETEQDLMYQRLHQALQGLNEDQRMVVMFHDMEGYTLSELEDIFEVPLGTLKSRLHRARQAIKSHLAMEPSDTLLRLKG